MPTPPRILALVLLAAIVCVTIPSFADDPAPPKAVEVHPGSGADAKVETIAVEGKGFLEKRNGNLVLHVAGTPYEMGFQHGRLLKEQVKALNARVQLMLAVEGAQHPKDSGIAKLKEACKRCLPFVPNDILEEMNGLAEGSGMPLEQVTLSNMIPELFHCSGFALWGNATKDGVLYHGRILDYAMEVGYHQFAVVFVAHPEGKHAFVSVGYAGFLGSVTGTNDQKVSFGEMGGRGEGNWDGMPMSFLMRKGLEEADTLDKALAIFRDTKRTCEYYYVISDAKVPDARGLYCTPEKCVFLAPGELKAELPVPLGVKDCVLMSGGDRFRLLSSRVVMDYGQIDGPQALSLMRRPVAMKSAIHTALMAPGIGKMWISNAVGMTPASECPYTEYDLPELFAARPLEVGR